MLTKHLELESDPGTYIDSAILKGFDKLDDRSKTSCMPAGGGVGGGACFVFLFSSGHIGRMSTCVRVPTLFDAAKMSGVGVVGRAVTAGGDAEERRRRWRTKSYRSAKHANKCRVACPRRDFEYRTGSTRKRSI